MINSKYLHNINFIKFMKWESNQMIGRVHVSHERGDIEALLVPVQVALDECNGWSNQDITKAQFLAYLRENDVEVFNSVEDFVKLKKRYPK